MPLLLRPTAPSPSIDELAFIVTAAPLSAQASQRSVSSTFPDLPRCTTHSRVSRRRRRGSTAGTETESTSCGGESCKGGEHHRLMRPFSHHMLRHSRGVRTRSKDTDFPDSKRSSHGTQPDDDHIASDSSFVSEVGYASSVLSCGCSHADVNDLHITSSSVIIEDQQLAVVDKELRDLRKTLVRKLYSQLTRLSSLGRKKAATSEPVC